MNFELNGHAYSAVKLPALSQFHVARRLSPLLKGLSGVVEALGGIQSLVNAARTGNLTSALISAKNPITLAQPFAEALSGMSDDDVNYIVRTCMSVVQRQTTGGTWGPVQAPGGALMYSDIEWIELIQIVQKVIEDNLANFTFATAPLSGQ